MSTIKKKSLNITINIRNILKFLFFLSFKLTKIMITVRLKQNKERYIYIYKNLNYNINYFKLIYLIFNI